MSLVAVDLQTFPALLGHNLRMPKYTIGKNGRPGLSHDLPSEMSGCTLVYPEIVIFTKWGRNPPFQR